MAPAERVVEQLRILAGGDGRPAREEIAALTEAVSATWPPAFPDRDGGSGTIAGRPCPLPARDLHVAGLIAAAGGGTTGTQAAAARLRYHARWLLALADQRPEAGPSVSIVIPIYNRAWLAKAVVENCEGQTYRKIEIVVVDDGSNDDTARILSGFDDRIRLVRQANGDVSAARNAGVAAATGDFIQFLDSDNLLEPACVAEKVAAFAAFPDAELCYCGASEAALFGTRPPMRFWSHYPFDADDWASKDLLRAISEHGFPFLVTSVMMPRWVVLETGGFDTDLRNAEDSRYWFRLGLRGTKAIGIRHRLFVRCIMSDGLNIKGRSSWTPRAMNAVRNLYDALVHPERWPQLIEYVARPSVQRALAHAMDSAVDAMLAADNDRLIERILAMGDTPPELPSPLPILLALRLLLPEASPADMETDGHPSFRARLLAALAAAADRAPAMSSQDRALWQRGSAGVLAAPLFRKLLADPAALSHAAATPKSSDGIAFLRELAGVPGQPRPDGPVAAAPRPLLAMVLPVLNDPAGAAATIASFLAGAGTTSLEILVVDHDPDRLAGLATMSGRIKGLILTDDGTDAATARSLGLQHATARLVRLAMPGDLFTPGSILAQAQALQNAGTNVFAVEVPASAGVGLGHRSLSELEAIGIPSPLSRMLFPLSLLRQTGGFDAILGSAHEDRYRLRIAAGGVGAMLASEATTSRQRPFDLDQRCARLAALSNFALSLRSPLTWVQLPGLAAALTRAEPDPGDRVAMAMSARLLEHLERCVAELAETGSLDGEPAQAAFALALAGLGFHGPHRDLMKPEARRVASILIAASRRTGPHVLGSRSIVRSASVAAGRLTLRNAIRQARQYVARDDPGSALEGVYAELVTMIRNKRESKAERRRRRVP